MKARQLHFLNRLGFSSSEEDFRPCPVGLKVESEIKTLDSVKSNPSQKELLPLMGSFAAMTELSKSSEGAKLRDAMRKLHADEASHSPDKG